MLICSPPNHHLYDRFTLKEFKRLKPFAEICTSFVSVFMWQRQILVRALRFHKLRKTGIEGGCWSGVQGHGRGWHLYCSRSIPQQAVPSAYPQKYCGGRGKQSTRSHGSRGRKQQSRQVRTEPTGKMDAVDLWYYVFWRLWVIQGFFCRRCCCGLGILSSHKAAAGKRQPTGFG